MAIHIPGVLVWLLLFKIACQAAHVNDEDTTVVLSMPPVQPTQKDEYICHAKMLDVDEAYFHSVETRADREVVHHAGVCFCEQLVSMETIWTCTNMTGRLCTGSSVTVGGWDDFTETDGSFQLPKDVGIPIGKKTRLKYVVFQVHFRGPMKDPSKSAANVTLLVNQKPPLYRYQMYTLTNTGHIPARTEHGFFSEVACPWEGPSVTAFSYVVHTHQHGLLVEGFLIRDGRWILIGSHRSVGRTKRRYDVPGGPIEIRDGDILAARCLYLNKTDRNILFGSGIDDEMCNFMIDFAYKPEREIRFNKIIACNENTPEFSFCRHDKTAGIC